MRIIFTRHSRRRMRLYRISEEIVNLVLKKSVEINHIGDKKEAIATIKNFKYPLKVVFREFEDKIIIITVYPLKKGLKK